MSSFDFFFKPLNYEQAFCALNQTDGGVAAEKCSPNDFVEDKKNYNPLGSLKVTDVSIQEESSKSTKSTTLAIKTVNSSTQVESSFKFILKKEGGEIKAFDCSYEDTCRSMSFLRLEAALQIFKDIKADEKLQARRTKAKPVVEKKDFKLTTK